MPVFERGEAGLADPTVLAVTGWMEAEPVINEASTAVIFMPLSWGKTRGKCPTVRSLAQSAVLPNSALFFDAADALPDGARVEQFPLSSCGDDARGRYVELKQRYWSLAREASTLLDLPRAKLAERRLSKGGATGSDPRAERLLVEVMRWPCCALESSKFADGGVARDYFLIDGWTEKLLADGFVQEIDVGTRNRELSALASETNAAAPRPPVPADMPSSRS